MDSIGAEVGQKMRSAIKAKLLELNCYVDEELPDYIMVMVANKRSKSQMNEDLGLFLAGKTSTFVEWLHIVLKKLKEVTVTNPDVYKKVAKRKSSDTEDVKVKKEKKLKQTQDCLKSEDDSKESLTDNLPVIANRLSEHRKISTDEDSFDIPLLSEVSNSSQRDLDEIEKKIKSVKSRLGLLVESDEEIKPPQLKSEKGESEYEKQNSLNANRIIELQNDEDEVLPNCGSEQNDTTHFSQQSGDNEFFTNIQEPVKSLEKRKHTLITFEKDEDPPKKKPSILDRLGKKPDEVKRTKISLSEFRKEEERFTGYSKYKDRVHDREDKERIGRSSKSKRERSRSRSTDRVRNTSNKRDNFRAARFEVKRNETKAVLSRLGVMSTIHIPQREREEPEIVNELKTREVRSMVQVKPRVIPVDAPQPNKNLLLKAVAEAHRSVAQAPKIRNTDDSPKRSKLVEGPHLYSRKLSQSEKTKLRNIILSQVSRDRDDDDYDVTDDVYVPKPLHKTPKEAPQYIPSTRHQDEEKALYAKEDKRQFIVTLEGAEKSLETITENQNKNKTEDISQPVRKSAKLRLQGRKSPSPIIFDKVTSKVSAKLNVPDKLPIVRPPLSIKNKEKCKYWPSCRQGDKCEFIHPNTNCEMFPNCKFGDKCLFLHPSCKFGTSCTKRDCPYSHSAIAKSTVSHGVLPHVSNKMVSQLQTCKYFPSCSNISCPFYHPKPCKFGKYCKNPAECTFSHISLINKSSLTWRPK